MEPINYDKNFLEAWDHMLATTKLKDDEELKLMAYGYYLTGKGAVLKKIQVFLKDVESDL